MIDVLVVGGVYRETFPHSRPPKSRMGGSGLVAAAAAAGMGASTSLAAVVGAADAVEVRKILTRAGIDGSAVETVPGRSATFVIEDAGEVEAPRVAFEEAQSAPPNYRDPPPAKVVLVFGMPDLDLFAAGLVARWIAPESIIIWDRQGWLSKTPDAAAVCAVPASSRVYVANIGEAAQEAGGATTRQLLQSHPLPGFDYALLKNGRWGTTLLSAGDSGHPEATQIPAFSVPAVSTIGSGDVFAGSLAAGLARGDDIRAVSVEAAAAAAVAISARSPLLDRSARQRMAAIISAAPRRYVDPVYLSETVVMLDAANGTALDRVTDALTARLRALGLRVERTPRAGAQVKVRLLPGGQGLAAEITWGRGNKDTVEVADTSDLHILVNAIADSLTAAQELGQSVRP